ncbi:MAG: hypothetical protein M3Y55_16205 [Pseudomonadota bacterium]|nr:hypothetical protein [Pseudomonadota bacterium]
MKGMAATSVPLIRHAGAAVAAASALGMLVVFYLVVAGAVTRAAERRSDAMTEAVALRAAAATSVTNPRHFATRKVSLVRAGD